jgi:hypothetical protein
MTMLVAGLACLVHALIPGLFVKTGSMAIARLHDRMIMNRTRKPSDLPAKERRGLNAE